MRPSQFNEPLPWRPRRWLLRRLAEVPVLSDPAKEWILGREAADVLADLVELECGLGLPDVGDLLGEVVLVVVEGRSDEEVFVALISESLCASE